MEFSKLYIDENGFLMCGPKERSTSIVEGLRFSHNNQYGSLWSFEINFINDIGKILTGRKG